MLKWNVIDRKILMKNSKNSSILFCEQIKKESCNIISKNKIGVQFYYKDKNFSFSLVNKNLFNGIKVSNDLRKNYMLFY